MVDLNEMIVMLGIAIGTGIATHTVNWLKGLPAVERRLVYVERNQIKLREDMHGMVQCMCKSNPKFDREWKDYRAKQWLKKNGGNGK